MFSLIFTGVCMIAMLGAVQSQEAPTQKAPATQPATKPDQPQGVQRKPVQAEILRNLLSREERPRPIEPRESRPIARDGKAPTVDAAGQPLFVEGTVLSERPGRLVHEAGRAKFVFRVDDSNASPRTMELLETQLLEVMERESEAGFTEFIITAEITRYRDQNYLLLRKVLRRTGHGNIGPQ